MVLTVILMWVVLESRCNMKEFVEKLIEKIKVTSLEIIVTGTKDKPYFEIKYKEVGKEDYNIGYSSYDLNNVLNWKEECFEIVNQFAEEYKEKDCSKCSRRSWYQKGYADAERNNGWIPCSERLPEICNSYIVTKMCENDENRIYETAHEIFWTSDGKWDCERDKDCEWKVIAWRKKPAPYQKGE